MVQCLTTNYIYTKLPTVKQSEVIDLLRPLSMTTEWVTVQIVGPDSILHPGDLALISARPTSYTFTIGGVTMHNLDDKATIAFKHGGELRCTRGTFLSSWVDDQDEEVSAGGIILTTKAKNAVEWAVVHAVGPECGFGVGDLVLLKYDGTAYPLEIDGVKMGNHGSEEVIAVRAVTV